MSKIFNQILWKIVQQGQQHCRPIIYLSTVYSMNKCVVKCNAVCDSKYRLGEVVRLHLLMVHSAICRPSRPSCPNSLQLNNKHNDLVTHVLTGSCMSQLLHTTALSELLRQSRIKFQCQLSSNNTCYQFVT